MTIDALAAVDINTDGFVIKAGDTITVDKRVGHYLLLTPKGFVTIPEKYVGQTIKVYNSILTHLE